MENTFIDKLRAIILVEIKVVDKYENLITLIMNEYCGNSARNEKCRQKV